VHCKVVKSPDEWQTADAILNKNYLLQLLLLTYCINFRTFYEPQCKLYYRYF